MTAAIYQLHKQQQPKYICSACGSDRSCNCNAPAVEKLAELKESGRHKQKAYRERKKAKQNQSSRYVTQSADERPTTITGWYGQIGVLMTSAVGAIADEDKAEFFTLMRQLIDNLEAGHDS